jgi:hypothetical protein
VEMFNEGGGFPVAEWRDGCQRMCW